MKTDAGAWDNPFSILKKSLLLGEGAQFRRELETGSQNLVDIAFRPFLLSKSLFE